MTVEEKAKDLIVKEFNAINEWRTDWSVLFHKQKTKPFKAAKRAAIVVCDEVLGLLHGWPEPRDITITTEINRYKKIKKHIEDNY